jgi:arginine/lysine/ornithine decarboxylase
MPELYQELVRLAESEMYPFHMPGHKRNLESTPMKGAFRCDITEIDGFDNLHAAEGVILEAQNRANRLYGADETFFLVNGSTAGVLSAVSAAVNEYGTILAARGSHKSFYHAAYLRHLNIEYLPYKLNSYYGMPEGYTEEDVGKRLNNKVSAVFITSPTYEGICSDIEGIARLCHENNIPLIVDEAHGAHFGFIPDKDHTNEEYSFIPQNAVSLGADVVIHSVHKTLPSMTQTALIHVRGKLVDKDKLKRFLRIYQSSSPSYVLMASIDLCMKEMEENGGNYVDKLLDYRNKIQQKTKDCKHIKIPSTVVIQDASKVVISVKNTAMTGQQLYDILREEYNLQMEMAAENYVLAIISGWDTEKGIDRLIEAICQIDATLKENSELPSCEEVAITEYPLPEAAKQIHLAWDEECEKVSLSKAQGRVSGDFINIYPPGIPLIVPGEVFSGKTIEDIGRYIDQGLNVQGILDGRNVICAKQR